MDVDDPYFDPDDPGSDHLLFDSRPAVGYEDPGLYAVPDAEGPLGEHAAGLHRVDEDLARRPTSLPGPDADDVADAEARELAAARRSVRRPRSEPAGSPDEGVSGAPRAVRDPVGEPAEDKSSGPDSDPGAVSERDTVVKYLTGAGLDGRSGNRIPKARTKKAEKAQPEFNTSFECELGDMRVFKTGNVMVSFMVPHDYAEEVLRLRAGVGRMLTADFGVSKRKGA